MPIWGVIKYWIPGVVRPEHEGLPWMLDDPYVQVALQAPPSPDYIPGPKELQSPPLPDFVLEPVYPEYMPQEDEVFPAEEQLLPAAASPTAFSEEGVIYCLYVLSLRCVFVKIRYLDWIFDNLFCLLKSLPELFEIVMEGAYGCILGGSTASRLDCIVTWSHTRLTNEIRQNGNGGNGDQPPTPILGWKGGKQKPRSFSSVTTPVDAKNYIAHIEKIFEVLGCADEFKARLESYKFEGDALIWWKVFKQAKRGETYMATLSWKDFRDIFFLQYFPRSEQQKYEREYYTIRQRYRETSGDLIKRFFRLAGFVGKKAGPPEEHAKHFKWALYDWILDGILNTKFTNVDQVANAARNMEILRERSSQNNKRNRDGDRIRPTTQDSNQRGYDQKGYDCRIC
ncbi:zinc finger, CCHC-type, retrotransposon gag domain protein [Tanacetum coccineum]